MQVVDGLFVDGGQDLVALVVEQPDLNVPRAHGEPFDGRGAIAAGALVGATRGEEGELVRGRRTWASGG